MITQSDFKEILPEHFDSVQMLLDGLHRNGRFSCGDKDEVCSKQKCPFHYRNTDKNCSENNWENDIIFKEALEKFLSFKTDEIVRQDGMKDSGVRINFGEGSAMREADDTKVRPDLISPFMLESLGEWMRKGAIKYATRNWEMGMPYSRCVASMMRHIMLFMQGKKDEDHLSAIIFNAMAVLHYRRIKGFDEKYNDLPKYEDIKGEK